MLRSDLTLPDQKAPTTARDGPRDRALWQEAEKLETQFLADMLRQAGFETAREAFGGGIGEQQFSSVLREAQAGAIVRHGGIDLSEHLFHALKERADAQG